MTTSRTLGTGTPLKRFDVAVVGLGAMGSAVLDQLAGRGAAVVGLDRHAPPHALGSSGGETRITRQGVGEGLAYVPLVLASHRIWRELEAETGAQLLTTCGTLLIGPVSRGGDADFVARSIDAAQHFGIPHAMMDGAEARRRFPQFCGLADEDRVYYEPGGGYVRPEPCIAAQLQRAVARGATVLTDTAVMAIEQEGPGVKIITATETIIADQAVVAAGAWTPGLLGAPFDRLLTVSRQVLHWYDLDDPAIYGPDSPVFIWSHRPTEEDEFYGFPPLPGERRIKVAAEQFCHTLEAPDAAARVVSAEESQALYGRHIAGRLAGVKRPASEALACFYTVTPDHHFLVDRDPEQDRVFVISACSGHGFKHSAGLGEAVAEVILGGCSRVDLKSFSGARFLQA